MAEAGVWADCARYKRPVLVNNYNEHPNRQGLPTGHSPIFRFTVSVVYDNKVKIIFGVGNRASDYDETDSTQLHLVANEIVKIIVQRTARTFDGKNRRKIPTFGRVII